MAWRVKDAWVGETNPLPTRVGSEAVEKDLPGIRVEIETESCWLESVDEVGVRQSESVRDLDAVRGWEPGPPAVKGLS